MNNLLNWTELSRKVCGNKNSLRPKYQGIKYKKAYNLIIKHEKKLIEELEKLEKE